MTIPLEIRFQGVDRSPAVETNIRDRVEKLAGFADDITRCRVIVTRPKARGHQGHLYRVQIEVDVPGAPEIVVGRDPGIDHAHEDVYVAIRDAFAAATRRVEDRVRRRAGAVKHHDVAPHGRVTQLFPTKDHGFLRTSTGEELYFHRNAVTDGAFDALEIGSEVRFTSAEGESVHGPQATSVTPTGKHHLVD